MDAVGANSLPVSNRHTAKFPRGIESVQAMLKLYSKLFTIIKNSANFCKHIEYYSEKSYMLDATIH